MTSDLENYARDFFSDLAAAESVVFISGAVLFNLSCHFRNRLIGAKRHLQDCIVMEPILVDLSNAEIRYEGLVTSLLIDRLRELGGRGFMVVKPCTVAFSDTDTAVLARMAWAGQ